jgi:hypothetical protein
VIEEGSGEHLVTGGALALPAIGVRQPVARSAATREVHILPGKRFRSSPHRPRLRPLRTRHTFRCIRPNVVRIGALEAVAARFAGQRFLDGDWPVVIRSKIGLYRC